MKNKLLIFDQSYDDPANFYHIIDKKDLESYTQNYIREFLKNQQKRTIVFDYMSHEINWKRCCIRVKFLRHAYQILNSHYKEGFDYHGFNFIELDKVPTWEAQAKPLKVKIEESLPYYNPYNMELTETDIRPIAVSQKPFLITIDDIIFGTNQVIDVPKIKSKPIYVDVSPEGYSEPPHMPSQRVCVRYDYEPVEIHVKATIKQVKELRNMFSTSINSTNPDTKRQIQNLTLHGETNDIHIEGFLRDMKFQAFAESEDSDYIDVELCFIIENISHTQ